MICVHYSIKLRVAAPINFFLLTSHFSHLSNKAKSFKQMIHEKKWQLSNIENFCLVYTVLPQFSLQQVLVVNFLAWLAWWKVICN